LLSNALALGGLLRDRTRLLVSHLVNDLSNLSQGSSYASAGKALQPASQ
jgi:hypothetical protein